MFDNFLEGSKCKIYTFFSFQSLHQLIPCGHHVVVKVNVTEDVILERSYTPVLDSMMTSFKTEQVPSRNLHFLIKIYPNGAVTQYLTELKLGSTILLSDTKGTFDCSLLKKDVRHLVVVYAGTGLTPMVKVIMQFINSAESSNSNDKYTLTLLCFNKTIKDIIWSEQLVFLEKSVCDMKNLTLHIQHILSQEEKAPDRLKYRHGRISLDLLKSVLSENLQKSNNPNVMNNQRRLCCICGPIPFIREAKVIFENEFAYTHKELHVFEG